MFTSPSLPSHPKVGRPIDSKISFRLNLLATSCPAAHFSKSTRSAAPPSSSLPTVRDSGCTRRRSAPPARCLCGLENVPRTDASALRPTPLDDPRWQAAPQQNQRVYATPRPTCSRRFRTKTARTPEPANSPPPNMFTRGNATAAFGYPAAPVWG